MTALHASELFVPRAFKLSSKPRASNPLAARIALMTALIAAPWAFGAVDAWAWTSLGLAVCLTVILWVASALRRRMLRITWSALYIPLGVFFLLALTQYFLGQTLDRSETRQALVLLAIDLVFFFIAVQLFSEAASHEWRGFGLVVLLFAGVMGLFAILQFASGTTQMYWSFDTSGQFFGPYSNPDHYAGLMEMLVPVAACYVASQREKTSLAILSLMGTAVLVAAVSLLLTGSRGGLLALSSEVAIAGIIFHRKAQGVNPWGLTASLIGVVMAVLLLFAWIDPGSVAKRLGVGVAAESQSWASLTNFRKHVAIDSFHMLRSHPLLGVGLGDFAVAYPRFQSFPTDLSIDYAHDDFVQAAAETGVVGAGLIVIGLVIFLRQSFRRIGECLHSGSGWTHLGATLGCCGLLVHSLVDFNLHIPANAAWFAVLAGVAVAFVKNS